MSHSAHADKPHLTKRPESSAVLDTFLPKAQEQANRNFCQAATDLSSSRDFVKQMPAQEL